MDYYLFNIYDCSTSSHKSMVYLFPKEKYLYNIRIKKRQNSLPSYFFIISYFHKNIVAIIGVNVDF